MSNIPIRPIRILIAVAVLLGYVCWPDIYRYWSPEAIQNRLVRDVLWQAVRVKEGADRYASDHNGQFPESLAELQKYLPSNGYKNPITNSSDWLFIEFVESVPAAIALANGRRGPGSIVYCVVKREGRATAYVILPLDEKSGLRPSPNGGHWVYTSIIMDNGRIASDSDVRNN